MQRWMAVYNAIPGTGKIITLATFYMKKNDPNVRYLFRALADIEYIILTPIFFSI